MLGARTHTQTDLRLMPKHTSSATVLVYQLEFVFVHDPINQRSSGREIRFRATV